jgi:DNA-binding NtrC family response regulator
VLRVLPADGTGSAKAPGVSGQVILLVDDDVELLKALAKVLEKDGYVVFAHSTANDAIRFVNESKQRFDLVITDVSMPGMKGTTFLSAVKTAFPRVPVIVITAFGDWGQYMETLREGAFDYLYKPLDKDVLLTTVRRALANGKNHVAAT